MGCKASKHADAVPGGMLEPAGSVREGENNNGMVESPSMSYGSRKGSKDSSDSTKASTPPEKFDRIYKLISKSQTDDDPVKIWRKVTSCCETDPKADSYLTYQNPTTKSTSLHMAVRLIDTVTTASNSTEQQQQQQQQHTNDSNDDSAFINAELTTLIQALVSGCPSALEVEDAGGNIPLHYAVAPGMLFHDEIPPLQWKVRMEIVRILMVSGHRAAQKYMKRNDVLFECGDENPLGRCTPLYRVLQTLPDDFEPKGPTFQYMTIIAEASPNMAGIGNYVDGDKPLSLLYRRFTRQFDISEKFFAGDNSRPEVVQHRRHYKVAAGNTWKIIELLLRPNPNAKSDIIQGAAAAAANSSAHWRIVHRAVQVETPPDLLRYIVETNPEDLTQLDDKGNSPLHYAAKSVPPDHRIANDNKAASFPSFYTKYVVDELLYKFPEGAKAQDANGEFPLTLAIKSGKQWIGGGIKSLYDAYPDALKQTNLDENPNMKRVLSIMEEKDDEDDGEKKLPDSVIKDEQHDAIMLVQQVDVDVSEVVTSMWAHEEDAGVQMLGCVAISRLSIAVKGNKNEILRISLSAVAAVVNAMKAHPNEVIVQEKSCHALMAMASADGNREVSFVASGAVAAIVGAMQAHVGDSGVQDEACGAISEIVRFGGADRATIVASVSGITAIINAIAAHPNSVGVQRNGCLALHEITRFPNANIPELPSSQTAPLLESAKTNFPKECGETAQIVLSRLAP